MPLDAIAATVIKRRETAAPSPGEDPFEFVMSDESVDRMGDVIEQDGWELDNFQRNPVALFQHNPSFPIGQWRDVAVKGGRLTGRLELLPAVSERLTELRAAVAAGVLRAVSVGFHPKEYEPIEGSKVGGLRFTQAELVECSLVSVPANPNALAIAKAVGISRAGQQLIFGGGIAAESKTARAHSGGIAESNLTRKQHAMNISERIEASQTVVNQLRDQLSQHLGQAGDNLDEPAMARSDELNAAIDGELRRLETLRRAETALGGTAVETLPLTSAPAARALPALPLARPFAMPKRPEKPGELLMNALIAYGKSSRMHLPTENVLAEYGWSDNVGVRTCLDWVQRSATAPATTTTTGWAAELVQTQYADLISYLFAASVYMPLSAAGVRYTLGRYGQISIPVESATPTVAGSFVAEGAPIPVRQEAFTPITIGLKKMAVISSFTRELFEHSQPNIDTQLRDRMGRDTSVAVDTILLDNNPATSVRPAGLRNGVTGLTPTAGGGFTALVGDLKQLLNVLIASNSLRAPVWIMNPQQALSISLTSAAAAVGVFPFKAEIEAGRLNGYPVIQSMTVPVGMVIIVDAADYASLTGDDARFELSDQATLHMEDTTPLAIGTPGSPPTVAAPTRSMFQTDSIALRMILPMNWIMRRAGLVGWVTGVTW
jgi:HK97 family phage major capsid protein/HK97 family phage prohead protease